MKYLMRAMSTAGIIVSWLTTAMADNKITPVEMADLVTQLANTWKVRINIDMSQLIDTNVATGIDGDPEDLAAVLAELQDD